MGGGGKSCVPVCVSLCVSDIERLLLDGCWVGPSEGCCAERPPRARDAHQSPRAAAEPGREQEPLGRGAGMGAGRREDGE